jgi:hypothetical protein
MLKIIMHVHEPVGVSLELDEKPDHQGHQENETASTTNFCNELSQIIELELKGSVLGITIKSLELDSAALMFGFCRRLTHHNTAVETFGSDSDNNVFADTFHDLRTGDDERILCSFSIDLPVTESLLRSNLPDSFRLASGVRLVTLNTMTVDENAVTRDDFAGFQDDEITDEKILRHFQFQGSNRNENSTCLNIDLLFFSITNYFDGTVSRPFIEFAELSLLLPFIEGTDLGNNQDNDDHDNTCDNVDTRRRAEPRRVIGARHGVVVESIETDS